MAAVPMSRIFEASEFSDLRIKNGLWALSDVGDLFFALDSRGHHDPTVESIADVDHGVMVYSLENDGMLTGRLVSWCRCHYDHPVVEAASRGFIQRNSP